MLINIVLERLCFVPTDFVSKCCTVGILFPPPKTHCPFVEHGSIQIGQQTNFLL